MTRAELDTDAIAVRSRDHRRRRVVCDLYITASGVRRHTSDAKKERLRRLIHLIRTETIR